MVLMALPPLPCRDETLSRLASQTELAFARGQLETWVDAFAKEARTHCIIVYDAMMSRRQEVSHTGGARDALANRVVQ
jgi:predicted RNA-binding protein with PIN domain